MPVAVRHPPHCFLGAMRLWCEMIASYRRRRTQVRMVLRALMLVLATLSVPSSGLDALQRPHCVQHGTSALHVSHVMPREHAHPAGESRAWSTPATHDCPHCPASECARVSPCTGSTTTALSPAAVDVPGLYDHRVAVNLDCDRANSATPPHDTPPPQLIA